MINHYIKEGLIVPAEVTIGLLKAAIESSPATIFLIDGFPRTIDQGQLFESMIQPCTAVMHLDASDEVCTQRVLGRAANGTQARVDDNLDSIKKRLKTHREVCVPVVEHYAAEGKVTEFDAALPKEEVTAAFQGFLLERIGESLHKSG